VGWALGLCGYAIWQMYASGPGRYVRRMAWTGKPLMWGEAPVGVEIDGRSRFHLPAGTATFLLSDIEGSTRLWSEFSVRSC
jgi:hypothetical protein